MRNCWFSLFFFFFSASGYNENLATRYQTQPQILNSNPRPHFDGAAFVPHDQLNTHSHSTPSASNDNSVVGLVLGPPQSSTSGFHTLGSSVQHSNLNPFDDWSHNRDRGHDDFFSEEDIRLRSHEMLENEEDMQQLLRLFSLGGHGSINMPEDGYAFQSFMPSPMPTFDEDRTRSGKAVVGWLKIKAAMRWGFFIRKKAAERRAQIVELEEED